MIRLGVAVKVLGRAGMAGRAGAHLSLGLLRVREVLAYLATQQIGYYRLPDDLSGGDLLHELAECGGLLDELADLVQRSGVRLTCHPSMHLALSGGDDDAAARAAAALAGHAALLDALGCGPEAVLVLHVGGQHTDEAQGLERFAGRFERLPALVRRRIAIEPDHHGFDLVALLRLHQHTGAPVVFDSLHHQLNNPHSIAQSEALALALATWPTGTRPEVHVSTQRTEGHLHRERGGVQVVAPRRGQHADFINPFEFAALLDAARSLPPFDVMLEAKAGDLALLRLRDDLAALAPRLAPLVW